MLSVKKKKILVNWRQKNKKDSYNEKIIIITIMQNENRFLKEWIDYHLALGIDNFILYDNISMEQPLKILQPYINKGNVLIKKWHYHADNLFEWNQIQCKAYKNAYKSLSRIVRWVLFLDIDEFLVLKSGQSLKEAIRPYRKYKAVGINWQLFGTSGIKEIPEGYSVCKTLTKKSPKDAIPNRHIKVIVDPSAVKKIKNPHWFILKGRDKVVDEDGMPISGPQTKEVKCKHFQINHYWTRDLKFLREVKYPRMKKYNPNLKLEDLIKSCNRDMNVVEDKEMIQIYDRLSLTLPEFK